MSTIPPAQRLTNVLHALRQTLERPPYAGQKSDALAILTQLEAAWQAYQAGTLAALDDALPF